MKQDPHIVELLLKSLHTLESDVASVEQTLQWIRQRNAAVKVNVDLVPFSEVDGWQFDPTTGNLVHASGKFFSIVGANVYMDDGQPRRWAQPLINQPEVGYLGLIAKVFGGNLYFLLQAKVEPGNVNNVQLSPTVQATRSNYSQVHKGKRPAYIEYFQQAKPEQIILDQLQSEQGARFYRKRNRNIIILTREDMPVHDDFCWLTLGQIKRLIQCDNVVNMDTRTVLSGLFYGRGAASDGADLSERGQALFASERAQSGVHSIDDILFWLSALKSRFELVVDKVPLREVRDGWVVTPTEIVREDRRFFRVIGVRVMIDSREVTAWCQPLVEPLQQGLCVFFCKRIRGLYHFLVQAKIECGNFDVVEMAPTIQCLTGGAAASPGVAPPRYSDIILNRSYKAAWVDSLQSEEGGRFFREQNRNMVVEVNDDFPEEVPENFAWLTLGQLKEFLRFNNYLNIQARSLIAALEYQ